MAHFDYMIPYDQGIHIEEGYSTIWENNLFFDTWLQPGITFTDKFFVSGAGSIQVRKPLSTTGTKPGKPGRDFDHKVATDEFVAIDLCNNFQESDKIYGAALASVQQNNEVKTVHMEQVVKKINEGVNMSALAALIDQASKFDETTALTKDNIKDTILSARQKVVEAKGTADVVICSPATYNLILKAAGDKFEPLRNDRIASDAKVGHWLGLEFLEVNGFAQGSFTYRKTHDSTADGETVNFSNVAFVMYNHEAFSVVHNLMDMSMSDGRPHFTGVFAQGEANFGFRVTNDKMAYVRTIA